MRQGGGSRTAPLLVGAAVLGALLIWIVASGHWNAWVAEPMSWFSGSTSPSAAATSTAPAVDSQMTVSEAQHALAQIGQIQDKRIPPYGGPRQFAATADAQFAIPLADAWAGGAWEWSAGQRASFAADPALRGSAAITTCSGAARVVGVTTAYQLDLPGDTITTLTKTLHAC